MKIKDEIGDQQYKDLVASISQGGKNVVTDYNKVENGTTYTNVRVIPESIHASNTADETFPIIINATVENKETDEVYNVVFNPETKAWVKIVEMQTDITKENEFTYFNDIDKAVENGDYNLNLLSQGNNAQPFSKETAKPEYYINVEGNFQTIDSQRQFIYNLNLDNVNLREKIIPYYTPENMPLRYGGYAIGKTSDGKLIRLFSEIRPDGNQKNTILNIGLDELSYQYGKGFLVNFILDKDNTFAKSKLKK